MERSYDRVRWTTAVLASISLGVAACAPAGTPSSTPPAAAAPSLAPSPAAQPSPSLSPVTAAGPEVRIVEPAFRPPQEWSYAPDQLSVKVATTVVWTNTGAVAHTVTADNGTSFDSGSIEPKAGFRLTPTTAGTFAYHCTFHPWMKGTLTVTP